MTRQTVFQIMILLLCVSPVFSQTQGIPTKKKIVPNINASSEYSNVFHSPSADRTPKVFHSILQMEIVVQAGDEEPQIRYANGTVVSKDGLIVSVIDAPNANQNESGGIQSASALLLDGTGIDATLVRFEPAYGVAVFRVKGLEQPPLRLSKMTPVANRRLSWHAVFKDGRKTFLYSRPLHIHKASFELAETPDLCQIIDRASSSLNAERSGSALVASDGSLVGIMGRMKHWNVSPKNSPPRTKTAWAVPASVIARLIESSGPAS